MRSPYGGRAASECRLDPLAVPPTQANPVLSADSRLTLPPPHHLSYQKHAKAVRCGLLMRMLLENNQLAKVVAVEYTKDKEAKIRKLSVPLGTNPGITRNKERM